MAALVVAPAATSAATPVATPCRSSSHGSSRSSTPNMPQLAFAMESGGGAASADSVVVGDDDITNCNPGDSLEDAQMQVALIESQVDAGGQPPQIPAPVLAPAASLPAETAAAPAPSLSH